MRTTILALALLPIGSAMTMEVADLRLELGFDTPLSTTDRQHITAGSDSAIYNGNTTTSNDFSGVGGNYDLKFVFSPMPLSNREGGLLISLGIAGWESSADYSDPGVFYDTTLYSELTEFQVGIGYGLPVTRSSYLEIMGDFGVGNIQIDGYDRSTRTGYSDIETASGPESSVGAHAGYFWRFSRHYIFGLEAGISRHFASSIRNDFVTGTHVDESFRQTLLDFRFAFGWHF